jgi:hypothetical protein
MAHQVTLELTPLEYLATPADLFFELTTAKAMWAQGIKEAKAQEPAASGGPTAPRRGR